jgi:hypothetical protein
MLQKICSWGVVGTLVLFILGGGIAFMTSDHPWIADVFFIFGFVLFLARFLTWEDAKTQAKVTRAFIAQSALIVIILICFAAIAGNHYLNGPIHLARMKAFSTIIPFAVDRFRAGIPYDTSRTDPLLRTYTDLAAISELPTEPYYDKDEKLITPKISDDDMEALVGHIMQYYILRTVNEIQNPVTFETYDQGKGLSATTNPPISVPNGQEYPNEKLFKLFEKLKLRFSSDSGANDRIWKTFKMKIPSGTKIDFVEVAESGKTNYIVRFERMPDLVLDFRIEPIQRNRGQGTFPEHFATFRPEEIQEAYSYVLVLHTDLKWTGERSVGQDYAEWVDGLEAGLRKKLVIP